MNEMTTRAIKRAIDGAAYGLNGPVCGRITRKPEPEKWVRIYDARKHDQIMYGRDLLSGQWFEIFDWTAD